jgi:NADH:ubiquinone oxidoreductase subunit E
MSLPISGGNPNPNPNRAPTHRGLDFTRAMKLGSDLGDEVDEGPITFDLVDELSAERGIPHSHLYASAAISTELEFDRTTEKVTFELCGGKCQLWGALERIDQLVDIRIERAEAGKKVFNIAAKSCLDKCEHAPVIALHTPDGTAVLTNASEKDLAEAVAEACGE